MHQLEREVVERTNALGILLGRSPKDLVDAAISVQGVSLPDAVTLPAALPSTVLERRPDIGAAEASLESAAADIGVARADMFPRISLTGLFGSISTELGDLFTKPAEAWSASGGIVQPLFEGGRLERERRADQGGSRAARRRSMRGRCSRRSARCSMPCRVRRLIAGARDANAEQVAALARATELAELRYTQGDIAYIDLLDVRRGLFQAQIDLVAAERDALLNTVDLALAVGGGLGDKAEPLSAKTVTATPAPASSAAPLAVPAAPPTAPALPGRRRARS